MEVIYGNVKKGRGIGKNIGSPTLNIEYEGELRGVFVGKVSIDGKEFIAAVHLGTRPSFNDSSVVCEAHLLDFTGEVEEGTAIKVYVEKKIREIEKFEDLALLSKRISEDVDFVKNWYNREQL